MLTKAMLEDNIVGITFALHTINSGIAKHHI